MFWLTRIIFVLACAGILGSAYMMSARGVWGASSGAKSVRSGTYIAGGRVK